MREEGGLALTHIAVPAPTSGRTDINLFEPDLLARDRRVSAWWGLIAVLATVLVGASLAFWQHRSLEAMRVRAGLLDAQAAQLRDEQARPAADTLVPLDAEIARLRAKLEQLSGPAETGGVIEIVDALAAATIDGVWLTRIRFERAPTALSIEGRARDGRLLPLYLQSLGRQPALGGMALATLEANRGEAIAGAPSRDAPVSFRIVSASTSSRPAGTAAPAGGETPASGEAAGEVMPRPKPPAAPEKRSEGSM